jgi:hypothetical protein
MAHLGLVKACIVHIFFINGLCVLALHTSEHEMLYILFHFRLVKSLPYGHSCSSLPMVPHHGHIMFFLHDLYVELPCCHIDLRLLPFEQSFFYGDVFHLSSLPQLPKISLCEGIVHISLPCPPFKATFSLEDGP